MAEHIEIDRAVNAMSTRACGCANIQRIRRGQVMPVLKCPWLRTLLVLLALALPWLMGAPPAHAASPDATSGQPIKAGDPVRVDVGNIRGKIILATYVAKDGTIAVSWIGVVQVAGLPLTEAAQKVKTAIGDRASSAWVTLSPITVAASEFYITGNVRKPGSYPWKEGLTVRDALLHEAGNVTYWCVHNWRWRLFESCIARISIVRKDAQGEVTSLSTHFIDHGQATGTELVQPGDLISVRVHVDGPGPD